ncbi:polycystin-2-like [Dreissena polymorpha]|uniref:polycystin-2-like n=1 Tax=Dreissena polymorpha TaxID=45954 RepID=UPI002264425D|nr:polycystin-2-like [Dreissena polymorpha]
MAADYWIGYGYQIARQILGSYFYAEESEEPENARVVMFHSFMEKDSGKVNKVETFYQYHLHDVAIPSLADMAISDHEYLTPFSNHFLLGPWRLRQLRVAKGSCYEGAEKIFERFQIYNVQCSNEYSVKTQDTGNYNMTWSKSLPENSSLESPWIHQSAWQLKTLPTVGKRATYSGGGYVVLLPQESDLQPGIIQDMWNSDWIDEYTRAVLLEFTVYNQNANLFTAAVIMFEYLNTGEVVPSHQFHSTKLFHYSTDFSIFVAMCEVLLFAFNVAFAYIEWKRFKVLGKRAYFSDIWSYVEIIQISLSYSVIGLFFQRMVSVNSVIDDYRASNVSSFISFQTALFWDSVLVYLMAFLVGLVTLKSIKLLRFNKRTFMIMDTVKQSKGMLLSFMFMACVFVIGFGHFCYLAFGKVLSDYRSFLRSVIAIFNFALGTSDFPGIEQAHRVLGPIFFVGFVFIVSFCFMTVFAAILDFGINESKALFMKRRNKIELLEYIIGKFKTIADKN